MKKMRKVIRKEQVKKKGKKTKNNNSEGGR